MRVGCVTRHRDNRELMRTGCCAQITITGEGMEVGSAVTLTNMMAAMQEQIAARPPHEVSSFLAVVNQLRCASALPSCSAACRRALLVSTLCAHTKAC